MLIFVICSCLLNIKESITMSSHKKIKNKFKHISENDRKIIDYKLDQGINLSDIAKAINKDKSAVSREIKKHRHLIVRANAKNKCGLFNLCNIKHLCDKCDNGYCKYCSIHCDSLCSSFHEYPQCPRVLRFPHVCNGCSDISICKLPKLFYDHTRAHKQYLLNVSEHKKGSKLSEDQLNFVNDILKIGLENNQSIDVIINTNDLPISTSTAYKYIWKGIIPIKPLDLKRAMSYTKRKQKDNNISSIEYDYRKNRTYEDWLVYSNEYEPINVWEMDCLEGKKGKDEHVLLSLLHRTSNLQLFFKLEAQTTKCVNQTLNKIKKHLGNDLFKEIFEVILTDNGSEFKDPKSMEACPNTGELLTEIFYCQPRRSDQKGKCEKNHVHLREAIPKAISFNDYSQERINEISNNINNYPRKMFNYNSPFQIISVMVNKKVLELNNLTFITPNKVKL